MHSNTYLKPTRLIGIGILGPQIEQFDSEGISFTIPRSARSPSMALLGHKIGSNLGSEDPSSKLVVEGAVFEILGELFQTRRKANNNSLVSRAEELLNDTFRKPLSLSDLANQLSVHPSQLAREFRRRKRITIGEYIRKLRIEYVCGRLRSSAVSLKDLAHEAGFTDHSHLSRTFKTLMGSPPSEFRAANRSTCRVGTLLA